MTDTLIAPDIDSLEELDFEVTCSVKAPTGEVCGKTAAWKVTMLCCGYTNVICEGHYEVVHGPGIENFRCGGCKRDLTLSKMRFERWK